MANLPIITFIEFLRTFQQVKRDVHMGDGFENDAEHSFQLAMVGWWIINEQKLVLDRELILKYALVHDLVETYAGDTNPLTGSVDELGAKEQKETAAAAKITKLFPRFKELHYLIASYSKKVDDESRFIYIVDKILPVINEYLSTSAWYRENGITVQKYKSWLTSKLKKSNYQETQVSDLLNAVVTFMEEQGIFAKEPIQND